MDGEFAEILIQQKVRDPFSNSAREVEVGWEEPVGNGAAQEAPQRHTHTGVPGRAGSSEALCSRRGCEPSCQGPGDFRPRDDPALGLQRLGRPEDRDGQAARPWCGFADCANRTEVSGRGEQVRRPRVSCEHFQPCGSRTRRSCCGRSQDRPIVLARGRLLSPGSARPGWRWPSAPWLSPAGGRVPRSGRHRPAENTGNQGLLR